MSWFAEDNDDEGEDSDLEGEGGGDDFRSYEDQIIFLIDARENMSTKNSRGEVHMINSLRVAFAVMKSKIIASANTSVGIIFFGTEKRSESAVKVFCPLAPPSASRMQQLNNLCEDQKAFIREVGYGLQTDVVPLKEGK